MWQKFVFVVIAIGGLVYLAVNTVGINVYAQKTVNSTPNPVSFDRSEVVLVTDAGRYRFAVEVAVTVEQRRRGLMFRTGLDTDAGMLFDYGQVKTVAMWMKNTLIPLDMIFISADGRIARIAEGAQPHSLEIIRSGSAVRAVLEVGAGTVRDLGLESGDWIEHEIFNNLTK